MLNPDINIQHLSMQLDVFFWEGETKACSQKEKLAFSLLKKGELDIKNVKRLIFYKVKHHANKKITQTNLVIFYANPEEL